MFAYKEEARPVPENGFVDGLGCVFCNSIYYQIPGRCAPVKYNRVFFLLIGSKIPFLGKNASFDVLSACCLALQRLMKRRNDQFCNQPFGQPIESVFEAQLRTE
jgi:hypothetical protein